MILQDFHVGDFHGLDGEISSFENQIRLSTESFDFDQDFKDLKSLYDYYFSGIEIDKKLAIALSRFQIGFVNKNEDHMAFFGGNLTGVQIVRFTENDKNIFFTDVIGIDDYVIEEELDKLPSIKKNFLVSSDVFNQTCMYLIHRFKTSELDDDIKQRAMMDTALILYYRFLTSLLFRYFKYPANKELAEATYAKLSFKFALKKHGSWYATLENRCKDLIDPEGLHHKTFTAFMPDKAVVDMLNDSQGRIRDMLKNIYSEMMMVKTTGSQLKTTSQISEYEGELIFKDSVVGLANYSRYVLEILSDENSFIKNELVEIIGKLMPTMPENLLVKTLLWMSNTYKFHMNNDVEKLCKEAVTHSFNYFNDDKNTMRDNNDLASFLTRLRGVYMSSRTQDTDLIEMRDLSHKLTKIAIESKNDSLVSSVKTGLMLYIVLRAFTMKHYTG